MNKVYIVEGQDRCGKGTLVDILRKSITNPKILVIHSAKPPKNVDPEAWTVSYYNSLKETITYLYTFGYDIILDRSWIGETVYGPIYRNVHIPLPKLELDPAIPQELIIMVDDPSSIASRSDGLSMSDNLAFLESERKAFVEAYFNSALKTKELIDWEYESYSKSKLEGFAKSMIGGERY
jgi:hypothetical protein